jgi:DNA-binding NtrC family response regulator
MIQTEKELMEYITRPRRILFIEDNEFLRQVFAKFATAWHCVFDTAPNAEKGLEMLQETPYDTVFLDMGLPDMKGVDLFRIISVIRPETNVVIISGYLNDQMINEVMEFGFAIFVKKPSGFRSEVMQRLFRTLNIDPINANSIVQPWSV